MEDGAPRWFQRAWNLELLGALLAVALVVILVWDAQQDTARLSVTPGSSVPRVSDERAGRAPMKLPRLELRREKEATSLRVSVKEPGYLLILALRGETTELVYPAEGQEAAAISTGQQEVSVPAAVRGLPLRAVFCDFPFGFEDVKQGVAAEIEVPPSCELAAPVD